MITSGHAPPFIIVLPYDNYSLRPTVGFFDEAFLGELLPWIDENYRTLPDRVHRAVGGLSRGASWAIHFALTEPDLFGAMGGHSPPVFIEEAKEEIANIRQNLPTWIDDRANTEALIATRRSFHTLKGSGRMVGAQLIGEFAWSIENLLNKVINQTLEPTPAMLKFVIEASGALPQLLEQLEIGLPPCAAYEEAVRRATGARSTIDVSDLTRSEPNA